MHLMEARQADWQFHQIFSIQQSARNLKYGVLLISWPCDWGTLKSSRWNNIEILATELFSALKHILSKLGLTMLTSTTCSQKSMESGWFITSDRRAASNAVQCNVQIKMVSVSYLYLPMTLSSNLARYKPIRESSHFYSHLSRFAFNSVQNCVL